LNTFLQNPIENSQFPGQLTKIKNGDDNRKWII